MTVASGAKLPQGWALTRLGDLFEFEYGKSLTKGSRKEAGKYPVYGSSGIVGMHDHFLLDGPAIIVGRKGAAGAVHYSSDNCWPIDTTYFVRSSQFLSPKFAYHLLKSLRLERLEASTAIPGLNRNHAYDETVFLPPLPEQNRIVAKIEEIFSELENGVDSLKTAQAQLKVYHQVLLKQAFEGKLTAKWRADNPDKLETANAQLKRLQQKRAQGYQQQLAKWEFSEKQGSKPKAPKSPPPLTAGELSGLRTLPAKWEWAKFGQIFDVYVGSTPSRKRPDFWNDGSIPWVSSGEVAFCRIKDTDEKITALGFENTSTEIHPAGTIMLAMIGEGKTRGQAAILDIEAAHNQNTAAIRVSETGVIPEFIYRYLVYQYETTRKLGSGNNQKALNKERVSDLIFPLCSIAEMIEIVRLIDQKLTEIDRLDQTINTSLQQSEALQHSILKKAVSGQLVPQDPNDEPASALLPRIKEAKLAHSSSKKVL